MQRSEAPPQTQLPPAPSGTQVSVEPRNPSAQSPPPPPVLGVVQTPPVQAWPSPQHCVPHETRPAGHPQAPLVHAAPERQQVSPQSTGWSPGQAHSPFTQAMPAAQQLLPHAGTSAPEVPGQPGTHWPLLHAIPPAQH